MLKLFLFSLLIFFTSFLKAQFLMDLIDTTKDVGKGMISMFQKYDHLRISGYMQPQFQIAESKGAKNYSGGDFAQNVDNRYMLRRGRLKFEYAIFNKDQPNVQFAFQFDGTERGVAIRDFWGRFFENKLNCLSVTTGMFARPFGYELNLSSSDRESPERGRMSQILMKTERDLGAMLSFEPRKGSKMLKSIKFDVGFFNGQGLASTADYDSYKDIISRLALKPISLHKQLQLSAGLSYLNGGFLQNTPYSLAIKQNGTKIEFVADTLAANVQRKVPRKYYGADCQIKYQYNTTSTFELRAEYWQGTQSATEASTETPATLLTEPTYIRNFRGGFLYFLYTLNKKHQWLMKYDVYDPNTNVAGKQIGAAGANLGAANIRYATVGLGYVYYFSDNLKIVFWYDAINNETTQLAAFAKDVKDDIFTCRLQFRF
jgi:hypothetical protein